MEKYKKITIIGIVAIVAIFVAVVIVFHPKQDATKDNLSTDKEVEIDANDDNKELTEEDAIGDGTTDIIEENPTDKAEKDETANKAEDEGNSNQLDDTKTSEDTENSDNQGEDETDGEMNLPDEDSEPIELPFVPYE